MSPYADPHSFLNPDFHFAVMEASNDQNQPGFQVYAALKAAGLKVTPVNPDETTIQGDPCAPNLLQLGPHFPDVVIFAYSKPDLEKWGLETLREMRDLGLFRLWAEPGCSSAAMEKFAADHHISLLSNFSIRQELERRQ